RQQGLRVDHPSRDRVLGELPVTVPARYALGEHQIVRLEEVRGYRAFQSRARWDLGLDEALLPPSWGLGRLRPNPMRVIAERLVKPRAVAQGAIDLDGQLGVLLRIQIDLHRAQELLWGVGERPQDRLAADDHESVLA